MDFYLDFWKRSFDFSGGSSRKDFWLTALVNFVVATILTVISPIVYMVFYLATLIPSIALTIRRLRDGGFSPWLFLTIFIPILGFIGLIVLTALPSKNQGEHAGGSGPKPFQPERGKASPELQKAMAQAGSLVANQRYQEAIKSYMSIASQNQHVAGECAKNIGASFYYMGSFQQAVQYFEIAKKYGENAHSMDLYINKAQNAMAQSKSA